MIALLFYIPSLLHASNIGGAQPGIHQYIYLLLIIRIQLKNDHMDQLLKRIANILKIRSAIVNAGKGPRNVIDESAGAIKKNIRMMNGRGKELMQKLIKNVPKAMGRLRKRVVDNKIVGNDARNLFTVILMLNLLVSWINFTRTTRPAV
jgi:hypothetical protein